MRVLLVHPHFPPDFQGGGEYIVGSIAEELHRRGVVVSVVTTGDPAQSVHEGIPVQRLPISRYRFNLALGPIARAARQADIIQTFTFHGCTPSWIAGRMSKTPVVCEVLGLFGKEWLEMRGRCVGRLFRLWEQCLIRIPFQKIVYLSEFSRDSGPRSSRHRARSMVNAPGIAHDACHQDGAKSTVLFVGKLESRKGIDSVMEVARRLPHIPFEVVGWSDDLDRIRSGAPNNVKVLGMLSGEPLFNAYARARTFFFPSHAETFGLVIVEAMASGCAVVSSVPLEFEGHLVSALDLDDMTERVRELWEDPEKTSKMGERNRRLAQQYTWESHVDRLLDTYEELLHGVRAPDDGENKRGDWPLACSEREDG